MTEEKKNQDPNIPSEAKEAKNPRPAVKVEAASDSISQETLEKIEKALTEMAEKSEKKRAEQEAPEEPEQPSKQDKKKQRQEEKEKRRKEKEAAREAKKAAKEAEKAAREAEKAAKAEEKDAKAAAQKEAEQEKVETPEQEPPKEPPVKEPSWPVFPKEEPAAEEPEPEETEQGEEEHESRRGRKGRRKKRRKSKNYLLRIFIVLCLLAALYGVLHLDYFTLNKIQVEGNDYLTRTAVLENTKIEKGMNIFDVHTIIEKHRIKKNLYVDSVSIRRELPDTLVITVTERTGLAQFRMGEKYVVTDNRGMVIEVSKEQREVTLVEGVPVKSAQRGSGVVIKSKKYQRTYEKALELIHAMDEGDLFFKKIAIKKGRVTAHIFDKLKVEGSYTNVMDALEAGTLKTVVYDLYQKGKKKGTIYVSGDHYCSFTDKR